MSFPFGLVILLLVMLLRKVNFEDLGPPRLIPVSWRRALTRRVPARVVLAIRFLFIWAALAAVAGIAVSGFGAAPVFFGLLLVAVLVVTFPWLIVRGILIPLRMHRAAFGLTRLARWVWRWDHQGGPAFAAVLALWRRRKPPTPEQISWLEVRILGWPPKAARGGAIAAYASLAALRLDGQAAFQLFESIELLDPRALPRPARALAARFLLLQAALAGNWALAARYASAYRRVTFLAPLVAELAAQHLDEARTPRPTRTWILWSLAPRRRLTRPLVKAALAEKRTRAEAGWDPPDWPWPTMPPFDAALRAHAVLARSPDGPTLGGSWRAAAQAWGAAFEDRDASERVAGLAAKQGIQDPRDVLGIFGSQVYWDLVCESNRPGVTYADFKATGAIGARVGQILEDLAYREIDLRGRAILTRLEKKKYLDPVDEWREFDGARRVQEDAGIRLGDGFRRGALDMLRHPVESLAVDLFNRRGQRAIANAMFRWLGEQGASVGADAIAAHARKNASIPF
jgi:hypothetical protein